MANKAEKLAVLAFAKKIVASDGYMYGTTWDERHTQREPIPIVEKWVRGTKSHYVSLSKSNDLLKLQKDLGTANLQVVDSASLLSQQDTLTVEFSLKFLSGVHKPTACNLLDRYEKILAMGDAYAEKYGYTELAKRYVLNIANGRFLWRNRVGAEKIEVIVTAKLPEGDKTWTFNAYEYSIKDFDRTDKQVEELARYIAEVFSGETSVCKDQKYLLLQVTAHALVGMGQEVYPSEEIAQNKGKLSTEDKNTKEDNDKNKILYQVNQIAAMHSQKLNNAIRTIDTWYPAYVEGTSEYPIAIEPFGAVTPLNYTYRAKKNINFYDLFKKYSQNEPLSCEEDEHYVMAVLIRGGVFGEGGK